VISKNNDAIRTSVKVPFLPATTRQSHLVKIAETDYVNPDNSSDVLKMIICVPNVTFDEDKLTKKYGALNTDKVNFTNDIKSFVLAHSVDSLKKKVAENNNTLRFKLNDQCVELTYKEDFHLSAVEYFENTQKSN
jgi:hypothetical protein